MDTPTATVLAYFEALTGGDADATAETFAPDGVLLADEVPTLAGREVIRGALKGMLQDMRVVARPTVDSAREEGDWAFVQTSSTGSLRIISADVTRHADHRELFVLRRLGEGWRIAYYMFNEATGLTG